MLEHFTIFSKTGIVFYAKAFVSLRNSPIETLIQDILLEEKASELSTTIDQYTLKWRLDNQTDLVFVAVYQKSFPLTYVELLLERVRDAFVPLYVKAKEAGEIRVEFDAKFTELLFAAEKSTQKVQQPKPQLQPNSPSKQLKEEPAKKKKKGAKKGRSWNTAEEDTSHLNYSNEHEAQPDEDVEHLVDKELLSKMQKTSDGYDVPEMEVKEDAEEQSGWLNYFSKFVSGKKISEADMESLLRDMKERLINKNVAKDIADSLCDSVSKSLIGQQLGTFESLSSAIKKSLEASVKRILTPKTSTDLLRDIHIAKNVGSPYSIVFIGVNGVGKSTNLSKTCFWLLQNKFSVLIAACDTFRSGAVEQLKTHVRNLKKLDENSRVELYEKGYGKDSASIAKDAIQYAKSNKFDVVLIDTAGRMQDNEPLMRALSKLVALNNPNKIIFVGEALVGNEAVDQLTKFNKALQDFSGLQNPRQIDGIILTKFDTVDDKVGAALSMTYVTGKPILFVGTGQTYTDLQRMNVKHIAATLL